MNPTVERTAQTNHGVLVCAGSVVQYGGQWFDVLEDTVFFDPHADPVKLAMLGKLAARRNAA